MTQEQKDKMEQEVRAYTIPYIRNHGQHMGDIVKQDFTSIYQTILDNPQEWGLTYPHSQKLAEEVIAMQSENQHLRDSLEKAINVVHSLSEPIQELIDILEDAYYE